MKTLVLILMILFCASTAIASPSFEDLLTYRQKQVLIVVKQDGKVSSLVGTVLDVQKNPEDYTMANDRAIVILRATIYIFTFRANEIISIKEYDNY